MPGGLGVASKNRINICPPFVRALPPSIWKSHICVLTVNHNISPIDYWINYNNFHIPYYNYKAQKREISGEIHCLQTIINFLSFFCFCVA